MSYNCDIKYYNTDPVKHNSQTTATSNASDTEIILNGETQAPVDMVEKKAISQQDETNVKEKKKTKRTQQELKTQLSAISKRLGINDTETITLVSRIAGYSENELLDVGQDVLNKTIQSLNAAINDVKNTDNKKDYIEQIAKLAKNYNIALNTGWTIDGFKKYNNKNSENINDRLIKYCKLSKDFDISKCSAEERKKVLHQYFNLYFQNLKNDPRYKNVDIHKLQLQDFGKLLINSTDEEQKAAMDALKELYSDNKIPGFEALLRSFETEEERMKCAESVSYDVIMGTDAEGKMVSDDDSTKFAVMKTQVSSKEGIQKSHKELNTMATDNYNEHKEILEKIFAKKLNNEELTPEEEEILNKYNQLVALQSGEMVGTVNNNIVTTDAKYELLGQMNYDAYQVSENNYRGVLNQANQYTEMHQDELTVAKSEFDAYLNAITDGNYTTIITDAANGTTTELNVPTPPENKPEEVNTSSAYSDNDNTTETTYSSQTYGAFYVPDINIEASKKTIKAYQDAVTNVLEINDNANDYNSTINYLNCKAELKFATTAEARKELVEKYGKSNFIQAAIKGNLIGAKNYALSLYENLSDDEQLQIWSSADSSTKIALLYHSSQTAIMDMPICSNQAINKLVEAEREEIKKDNPELYEAYTTCQS